MILYSYTFRWKYFSYGNQGLQLARIPIDGLNTINNTYKIVDIQLKDLYTRILVDIDQEKVLSSLEERKAHFTDKPPS